MAAGGVSQVTNAGMRRRAQPAWSDLTMHRLMICAGVAALLAAAPGARASVTVIGGGLAEACSKAALSGKSDANSEKTCTTALDTEMLSPRDRAGTFVNRGVLKLRRGRFEAATKDFDTAVQLRPN